MKLTALERQEFADAKTAIRAKLSSFIEVGEALLRVRDKRLYREEYKTFEAFALTEFSIKRSHANRLIDAAKIARNLSPMGTSPKEPSGHSPACRLTLRISSTRKPWKRPAASPPPPRSRKSSTACRRNSTCSQNRTKRNS